MEKKMADEVQMLFASEPRTYRAGNKRTGVPYWNVLELMEILEEPAKTPQTVALFLGRFEALAPRSASKTTIRGDIFVYDQQIKRMTDRNTMENIKFEDITSLKEEELPSLFFNRSWAERIRHAKLEGGIRAMAINGISLGRLTLPSRHQAMVIRLEGPAFPM
jgi:hypothetical protein